MEHCFEESENKTSFKVSSYFGSAFWWMLGSTVTACIGQNK